MKKELKAIEISKYPELVRIAKRVRKSGKPRILRRNGEALAIVSPVRSSKRTSPRRVSKRASYRRGKATSAADPLWNIIGIAKSQGPTDVSENKHKYLAEAYANKGR